MNVSDLLAVLPVKLASGVVLVLIVAWALTVFRPWLPGEEPSYLRYVRIAVVVVMYLAFAVLIGVGVYLVVVTSVEQPTEWGAASVHHVPGVPDEQSGHPSQTAQPSQRPHGDAYQPD